MAIALSFVSGAVALLAFLAFADVLPVLPCRRAAGPAGIGPEVMGQEREIRIFAEAVASGDARGAERAARAAFRIQRHRFRLRRWSDPVPA